MSSNGALMKTCRGSGPGIWHHFLRFVRRCDLPYRIRSSEVRRNSSVLVSDVTAFLAAATALLACCRSLAATPTPVRISEARDFGKTILRDGLVTGFRDRTGMPRKITMQRIVTLTQTRWGITSQDQFRRLTPLSDAVASGSFLQPWCSRRAFFHPANVYRISCGEAPCACEQSGTPLAATNDIVGGQRLQAA